MKFETSSSQAVVLDYVSCVFYIHITIPNVWYKVKIRLHHKNCMYKYMRYLRFDTESGMLRTI